MLILFNLFSGQVIFYKNGQPSGQPKTTLTGFNATLNRLFAKVGNADSLVYASIETYHGVLTPKQVLKQFRREFPFQGQNCKMPGY